MERAPRTEPLQEIIHRVNASFRTLEDRRGAGLLCLILSLLANQDAPDAKQLADGVPVYIEFADRIGQ